MKFAAQISLLHNFYQTTDFTNPFKRQKLVFRLRRTGKEKPEAKMTENIQIEEFRGKNTNTCWS